MSNGHLEGLLTLHEVRVVPRASWARVTAGDVMRTGADVIAVRPEDDLLAAIQRTDDAGVGQLPVVSQDTLVGMLSREQLFRYARARTELGT